MEVRGGLGCAGVGQVGGVVRWSGVGGVRWGGVRWGGVMWGGVGCLPHIYIYISIQYMCSYILYIQIYIFIYTYIYM